MVKYFLWTFLISTLLSPHSYGMNNGKSPEPEPAADNRSSAPLFQQTRQRSRTVVDIQWDKLAGQQINQQAREERQRTLERIAGELIVLKRSITEFHKILEKKAQPQPRSSASQQRKALNVRLKEVVSSFFQKEGEEQLVITQNSSNIEDLDPSDFSKTLASQFKEVSEVMQMITLRMRELSIDKGSEEQETFKQLVDQFNGLIIENQRSLMKSYAELRPIEGARERSSPFSSTFSGTSEPAPPMNHTEGKENPGTPPSVRSTIQERLAQLKANGLVDSQISLQVSPRPVRPPRPASLPPSMPLGLEEDSPARLEDTPSLIPADPAVSSSSFTASSSLPSSQPALKSVEPLKPRSTTSPPELSPQMRKKPSLGKLLKKPFRHSSKPTVSLKKKEHLSSGQQGQQSIENLPILQMLEGLKLPTEEDSAFSSKEDMLFELLLGTKDEADSFE